jgi:hypothetical protein
MATPESYRTSDASGSTMGRTLYLEYPPALAATGAGSLKHWVTFEAFDFREKYQTLGIDLYIPPDALATSYKSDYESAALGQLAGRAVEAFRESGGNVENLEKTLSAKAAVTKGASTDIVKQAVTPAKFKTAMQAATGQVMNPYIVAAYKGPTQMREHKFSFKMMPEDEAESRKCVMIGNAFKQAMLPFHAGGDNKTSPTGLFGYPDEFEISFTVNGTRLPRTVDNPMFNIGRSVLTACDLSYTTQDTVLFFEGTQFPVTINMTLSFMEIEVMHRSKIQNKGL